MYKNLLMQLLEELHSQDILNDLLSDCDLPKEIGELWFEAHPRDSMELWQIMKEQFSDTEIAIITRDLDFDL